MKYLLLIVIVVAVIWYVRNSGRVQAPRSSSRGDAPRGAPPPPQDMIECPVCLVHLPRTDALAGPDGRHYCCADHLRAAK